MAQEFNIDDTVDITDVVCPTTFVKAKVALEELDDGQIISIHMNDGEPVQNVPRSIKEEGHQILKLINNEDGTYDLIVGIELSELDEEREDVKIVKINVNFDKPLAEKYGITATPTLIYFKGGEEKQRVTGRKSKKDIVAVLAELG